MIGREIVAAGLEAAAGLQAPLAGDRGAQKIEVGQSWSCAPEVFGVVERVIGLLEAFSVHEVESILGDVSDSFAEGLEVLLPQGFVFEFETHGCFFLRLCLGGNAGDRGL